MRFPIILIALHAIAIAQPEQYDSIYRGDEGAVFSTQPNAFLVEMAGNRNPGKALDLGMGQGRNSIFLARQGWDVTGVDSAGEGVRRAIAEAVRLGVRLRTHVAIFDDFDLGENRWDLIVLTYEPTKALAPRVIRALKPGGVVVVEDRHLDTRRVWPAGTFADNELIATFAGLRVIRYEDVWARPDWSANGLDERLVRLCAEKPGPRAAGCLWENKPVEQGGRACWRGLIFDCKATGWDFTREKCGVP